MEKCLHEERPSSGPSRVAVRRSCRRTRPAGWVRRLRYRVTRGTSTLLRPPKNTTSPTDWWGHEWTQTRRPPERCSRIRPFLGQCPKEPPRVPRICRTIPSGIGALMPWCAPVSQKAGSGPTGSPRPPGSVRRPLGIPLECVEWLPRRAPGISGGSGSRGPNPHGAARSGLPAFPGGDDRCPAAGWARQAAGPASCCTGRRAGHNGDTTPRGPRRGGGAPQRGNSLWVPDPWPTQTGSGIIWVTYPRTHGGAGESLAETPRPPGPGAIGATREMVRDT